MRFALIAALVLCAFLCLSAGNALGANTLEWDELPELPPQSGMTAHPGVAGSFAGMSGNALVIAGGANYPEKGLESKKVWHDDIYVLVKDTSSDETHRWVTGQKLDRPSPMVPPYQPPMALYVSAETTLKGPTPMSFF